MRLGIIGSGSWATALAKILTDNGHQINWWMHDPAIIQQFRKRGHHPNYLSAVQFDLSRIHFFEELRSAMQAADWLFVVVPAAFIQDAFSGITPEDFQGKKVVSAVKGILPASNELLNQYLQRAFSVTPSQYFTLLGPSHAEEIAAEKLTYLTFSGTDLEQAGSIASLFDNDFVQTRTNDDVWGVQYAAVLKNIYALGSGIVQGLEYGDNFLSVFISNGARELVTFLKTVCNESKKNNLPARSYATSVYLGDLLVTCYSPHSRNRTFGKMIGKGYSVTAARLELNMVAEGYYAARCIHTISREMGCAMPIADTVYDILFNQLPAAEGIRRLQASLL
ncbi:MAG: NAD(P)H-dependent glycerol-3-phosphate dehydrogenase [Bacteroidota bacterium]